MPGSSRGDQAEGALELHYFDFDNVLEWEPRLSEELRHIVQPQAVETVRASSPQYIEDSLGNLVSAVDPVALFDATEKWLESQTFLAYHGTRLNLDEIESVRHEGLKPLSSDDRKKRLVRVLEAEGVFEKFGPKLDEALSLYGDREKAGSRLGQVHLTLSRSGLTADFSHYLKYGSEFDQHVLFHFLDEDAYDALARDGNPYVIQVSVSGEIVMSQANRFRSLLAPGEPPNVVGETLALWAHRLTDPGCPPSAFSVDCGIVFTECVPPSSIQGIEIPQDFLAELGESE